MLQDESVDATHHHNRVEPHEESSHWTAEPKSAVQNDQRDGEQREPNMCAHPALQCAKAPEHDLFARTEQGRKNEDRKGDCTENETERCAADAAVLRWLLDQPWRQTESGRQTLRIKIADVNPESRDRGEHDKDHPRNVRAIKNPHDVESQVSDCALRRWRAAEKRSEIQDPKSAMS